VSSIASVMMPAAIGSPLNWASGVAFFANDTLAEMKTAWR